MGLRVYDSTNVLFMACSSAALIKSSIYHADERWAWKRGHCPSLENPLLCPSSKGWKSSADESEGWLAVWQERERVREIERERERGGTFLETIFIRQFYFSSSSWKPIHDSPGMSVHTALFPAFLCIHTLKGHLYLWLGHSRNRRAVPRDKAKNSLSFKRLTLCWQHRQACCVDRQGQHFNWLNPRSLRCRLSPLPCTSRSEVRGKWNLPETRQGVLVKQSHDGVKLQTMHTFTSHHIPFDKLSRIQKTNVPCSIMFGLVREKSFIHNKLLYSARWWKVPPPEKFWTISKAMAPSLVIPHTNPVCQLAPCFLMLQAMHHSHSLNLTLLNVVPSRGTR